MILDYTSGPHFDGFWVGAGFELWLQSIEHDNVVGLVGEDEKCRYGETGIIDSHCALLLPGGNNCW